MTKNNEERLSTKISKLKSTFLAYSLSLLALAGGTYNANGQNKDSRDSKVFEYTTDMTTDKHMEKCGAKEYSVETSIERVKIREGEEWITYSKASNIFEFGNGFVVEREIDKVNDNGKRQSETSCILRAPDGGEYDLSFLGSTNKNKEEEQIQKLEDQCKGAGEVIRSFRDILQTSPLEKEVGPAMITSKTKIYRQKGTNNVPQQINENVSQLNDYIKNIRQR